MVPVDFQLVPSDCTEPPSFLLPEVTVTDWSVPPSIATVTASVGDTLAAPALGDTVRLTGAIVGAGVCQVPPDGVPADLEPLPAWLALAQPAAVTAAAAPSAPRRTLRRRSMTLSRLGGGAGLPQRITTGGHSRDQCGSSRWLRPLHTPL